MSLKLKIINPFDSWFRRDMVHQFCSCFSFYCVIFLWEAQSAKNKTKKNRDVVLHPVWPHKDA